MPSLTFLADETGELVAVEQPESAPDPPRKRARRRCSICRELGHIAKACIGNVSPAPKAERTGGKWCRSCDGQSWRRPLTGCPGCGLPYQPEQQAGAQAVIGSSAGLLLEE